MKNIMRYKEKRSKITNKLDNHQNPLVDQNYQR